MLEDQIIKNTYQVHLTISPDSHEKFLQCAKQIEEDPDIEVDSIKFSQHGTLSLLNCNNILRREITTSTNLTVSSHPKNYSLTKDILTINNYFAEIISACNNLGIKIDCMKIEEPFEQCLKRNRKEEELVEFHFKFNTNNVNRKTVSELLKRIIHNDVRCSLVKDRTKENRYIFTTVIQGVNNAVDALVPIKRTLSEVFGLINLIDITKENVLFVSNKDYDKEVFCEIIDNRNLLLQIQDIFISNQAKIIKTKFHGDFIKPKSDLIYEVNFALNVPILFGEQKLIITLEDTNSEVTKINFVAKLPKLQLGTPYFIF